MSFYSSVKSVEISESDDDEVRNSIIKRIEGITLKIILDINSNRFPKIIYHNFINEKISKENSPDTNDDNIQGNSMNDCQSNLLTSFDSSKSLSWVLGDEEINDSGIPGEEINENEEKSEDRRNTTTIDFCLKKSRKNLILVTTVLSEIHKMLLNRTTKTRRSLYYQLLNGPTAGLAKNQRSLDDAVNRVANILQKAPWQLGLTATSKGLIYGDLGMKFHGMPSVSCEVPGGLLIPQNIHRVKRLTTRASFVLVVEKDAVFQKLLVENCCNYLNCLLITGKGYPDINTRMLVNLLGNRLKIPVYVLVDSDPFGIEIMCIYRFGSSIRSREEDRLSCSVIRYLGIHASEYSGLGIKPLKLTSSDKSRLKSLKGRNYVALNENLLREIKMVEEKGKVEIEAVSSLSKNFLTNVYINKKIEAGQFI